MLDYTDCDGRSDFSQENLADWLGIGTTTHGGYVRTVCGVFPNLRDVFTYADLEASITLPSGVTDFRVCGVAPYEYAGCDAPDCAAAVALGGVQVAVAGSAVTVTADSITLPSVGYLGGIDPPGGSVDPGLRIVGTVTYGGAQRYAVLNVDWRYDGVSANEASLSVLGECVPSAGACDNPSMTILYCFKSDYWTTDADCYPQWSYEEYCNTATPVSGQFPESFRGCLGWLEGVEYGLEIPIYWDSDGYSLDGTLVLWQAPGTSTMRYSFSHSMTVPTLDESDPCDLGYGGETSFETDQYATGGGRMVSAVVNIGYGGSFSQWGECVLGSCDDPDWGTIDVSGKAANLNIAIDLVTTA